MPLLKAVVTSRLALGLYDEHVLPLGPLALPDAMAPLVWCSTLGAETFEWSHRLLEPAPQALVRRLSVLRGGFTLEAARGGGTP